ncbi:hypothetical protein CC85DRAFT_80421 [Cutaneotrichosporon oleaginosum]|uniref:Uncharacterized protein n=1 Tax=Cutaneotrichosporon oleaginosum TaxID=879819 RepID=A0A0J1B4L9_9TREE|nr:uncharacterized protein CC85DRAFT_80421 [Cutaneotrichosporon oleaginosum]KLT42619.1 hypothetical protein CC85DRAFT_80421 [Cutaneotrichosporon oleaginosum]TXT05264.1 hypothetical protein COLE_06584 [Cutaneotrichosporon oleaginosum]
MYNDRMRRGSRRVARRRDNRVPRLPVPRAALHFEAHNMARHRRVVFPVSSYSHLIHRRHARQSPAANRRSSTSLTVLCIGVLMSHSSCAPERFPHPPREVMMDSPWFQSSVSGAWLTGKELLYYGP